MKENELYLPVCRWLEKILSEKYKRMRVQVTDSHNTKLSRIIHNLGFHKLFPQFNAWDIKVDVTGIISNCEKGFLALIECKVNQLTLRDVGQLLGYSIVANPILSLLISPQPPSDPLITLLKDYGRQDVLEYGPQKRHMRLAQWDNKKKEIIPSTIFPAGRLIK